MRSYIKRIKNFKKIARTEIIQFEKDGFNNRIAEISKENLNLEKRLFQRRTADMLQKQ